MLMCIFSLLSQDFENDAKLLKKVLTYALKKKKTYLTCELCEATKRSVQGFISHMQFCGKSEEVSITSIYYESISILYLVFAGFYLTLLLIRKDRR